LDSYRARLIDALLTTGVNPRSHYAPRGAAASLLASTLKEILISGPARTGKSLAALTKIDFCARQYPASRHLVVRRYRTSLTESGLVTFERDVLGLDHPLVIDGPRRNYRQSYNYANGSEIVVAGLDNPGKILSAEYDLIFIQQAEEVDEQSWQTLLTRLSSYRMPFQQILADCNPTSPSSWLYKRSQSGAMQYLQGDHRDNPLLYDADRGEWTEIGREYLSTLNLLTGTLRQRLRDGLWVQAEGVVYANFGMENLTDEEPDSEQPIELAIDDGYIDPRAILFIQRTGSRILVFDELYHSYHLAETCVQEMLDRCEERGWPKPELAAVPSEAKELQQRLRRADVVARPGTHRPLTAGIDVVRRLICDGQGVRSIVVNHRCKNLLRELTEDYQYPPGSARGDSEVPVDKNNHAVDALRYWCWLRARR